MSHKRIKNVPYQKLIISRYHFLKIKIAHIFQIILNIIVKDKSRQFSRSNSKDAIVIWLRQRVSICLK